MNFLVIEGNIGAGKTSLAKKIGDRFNAKVILEQFSDNPFLPGFYSDPTRYAFPLELSFLAARYNQVRDELEKQDLFKTFTVADYFFPKSLIFAASTLSGHEYRLFRQLYDIMDSSMPQPDLYVFLNTGTDRLLDNIKERGRPYEQTITAEYLEKIQQSYFDFMKQQDRLRFLVIDTGNVDFISSGEDFESVVDAVFVKTYDLGINHIVL